MNMLLHGVKDTEFDIHHGDTLAQRLGHPQRNEPGKKDGV